MEILTEFQKEFLKNLGKTSLAKHFFFGVGTALAHYYLKHRYSEDLDFFTTDEYRMRLLLPEIKEVEDKINAKLEIKRTSGTFVEAFLIKKKEKIMIYFALDSPFRFESLKFDKELNIYYENLGDLSCNKFSALFERHDAKDFVDVYFLSKEFMDFWKIFEKARKKHVGIEEYYLLLSLDYVRSIEKLPRMIKTLKIEELKDFYEDKIMKLMEMIKRRKI